MATHPARTRASSRPSKWFLIALLAAAVAVLALMYPSIKDTLDTDEPPPTEVKMHITVQSKDDIKACDKVTLARLQRATTAVAGTYQSSVRGSATFVADHWFRGGPANVVTVAGATASDLATALEQTHLNTGRVLIASRSGEVLMCGESGVYTTSLAADYVSAFEQSDTPNQ